MSSNQFDLAGRRFGKWSVLSFASRSQHGHIKWFCRCDCGNERTVRTDVLVKGATTSCGCAKTINLHASMIGRTFERLTVVAHHHRNTRAVNYWQCRCQCGNECVARTEHLTHGKIKSCGCLSKENTTKRNTTHGLRHTPEYKIWDGIIERCCNPNSQRYADYGGRGITICPEWRSDFTAFLAAVGIRPNPKLSIDRIDNDRGYEPGNVRWTTYKEQAANRRPRRKKQAANPVQD